MKFYYMKIKKILLSFMFIMTLTSSYSQKEKTNSDTRKFIDNAEFTQVNKDWSVTADFKSGFGEVVSFFKLKQ